MLVACMWRGTSGPKLRLLGLLRISPIQHQILKTIKRTVSQMEKDKTQEAIDLINKYTPIKVSFKQDSWLHRTIGWLLSKIGNPLYMDYTWTTLGNWIARPTCAQQAKMDDEWKILLHEGQHARDAAKIGRVLFGLIYLLPQSLALLIPVLVAIMIAMGCGWWSLLSVIVGLVLLPIPALGRACIEARAYTVSLAIEYWTRGEETTLREIESLTAIFAGPMYYWMWPFKSLTRKFFLEQLEIIKIGGYTDNPYLVDCKKMCD